MGVDMSDIKHNWTREEIKEIYELPIMELVYRAATAHRKYHDPNTVQVSTLLSIKTGGCPEDCGYCPQAARYHTDVDGNDLKQRKTINNKKNPSNKLTINTTKKKNKKKQKKNKTTPQPPQTKGKNTQKKK